MYDCILASSMYICVASSVHFCALIACIEDVNLHGARVDLHDCVNEQRCFDAYEHTIHRFLCVFRLHVFGLNNFCHFLIDLGMLA